MIDRYKVSVVLFATEQFLAAICTVGFSHWMVELDAEPVATNRLQFPNVSAAERGEQEENKQNINTCMSKSMNMSMIMNMNMSMCMRMNISMCMSIITSMCMSRNMSRCMRMSMNMSMRMNISMCMSMNMRINMVIFMQKR